MRGWSRGGRNLRRPEAVVRATRRARRRQASDQRGVADSIWCPPSRGEYWPEVGGAGRRLASKP